MSEEMRQAARRAARKARKSLEVEYHVVDSAGLRVLDRFQAALEEELHAKAVVEIEGYQVESRQGMKAHPLLAVARNAREQAIRCLKLLNFEPSKGV